MTSGKMDDGTPFVALGNSEPIPQWMMDRASEGGDLEALMEHIRQSRRRAGWCDHGLRLLSAPAHRGLFGEPFEICTECE